ncbi:leucine-rich repeat domain, L domain-like protein [Tanacetum coccineum]
MQNTTVGDRAMKAAFRTGVHNRDRDTLAGPRPVTATQVKPTKKYGAVPGPYYTSSCPPSLVKQSLLNLPQLSNNSAIFAHTAAQALKSSDSRYHSFHQNTSYRNPELLGPGNHIVDFPKGKIGVYTKNFEFANFRIPISQFLFDILRYYQIHLSQLCSSHASIDTLLKRYPHLESLSLVGCLKVSNSALTQLRIFGSKLYSLNLSNCSNVSDIGITSIASGCLLLLIIHLSNCSISDIGVETLTKSCKYLRVVDLSWCKNITDRGIWSLNQNCRRVRSLNVCGCVKVVGLADLKANCCAFDTKGVARILSGGGLQYLKFLNFERCYFVEDDAVMTISKGCRLLHEWNLSFCYKIGVFGWESIGLYAQNLKILNVSYCDNLGYTEIPPRCRMTFPKCRETGKREETKKRGNVSKIVERIKKTKRSKISQKPTRNGKDKAMSEDLKPKIRAGSV